ncbi:hypothetical protein HGA88_02870 [Candidatus Roizmanbacteria bacterium]|nr:hypothetical protein [Candidatus Roizmanbacteria bacterium]
MLQKYEGTSGFRFTYSGVSEGISDMNYLQVDSKKRNELQTYATNNPVLAESPLDLATLADISMPIADIGPYGFHLHESKEKVDIAFTFHILPRLLKDIIYALQK